MMFDTTMALEDESIQEARELKKLHLQAEQGQAVRLDLGRRLLIARPRWGKTGRTARGWDAFLSEAGISKRSAQRYMAIAGRADAIRDSVSRKEKISPVERVLKLVAKMDETERRTVLDRLQAGNHGRAVAEQPTPSADPALPTEGGQTAYTPDALSKDLAAANDNIRIESQPPNVGGRPPRPSRPPCSRPHQRIIREDGEDMTFPEMREGCACANYAAPRPATAA